MHTEGRRGQRCGRGHVTNDTRAAFRNQIHQTTRLGHFDCAGGSGGGGGIAWLSARMRDTHELRWGLTKVADLGFNLLTKERRRKREVRNQPRQM